jgi:hypothetical protein
MSLLEAYLVERRKAQRRLWLGYTAANVACVAMLLLMLYV